MLFFRDLICFLFGFFHVIVAWEKRHMSHRFTCFLNLVQSEGDVVKLEQD